METWPAQTDCTAVSYGFFPPLPPRILGFIFLDFSFFFFFSPPISIQLQIMATPRVWMHSGSRELQQPKHVFPFRWGVAGFLPEQTGLKLSHDFCECGQGRKEGKKKKKKHDYTRTSFISVHSRQKEKKTIQEQDVPSLKAFSLPCPSPLLSLSFYNQKLHRICFSIRKLNLSM